MITLDDILQEGDVLIKENNVEELSNVYESVREQDLSFDMGYVFQKLFLKACLYGNRDTISWFFFIYKRDLTDMSKIAYRHTLYYGKYLIKKRKDKELFKWYSSQHSVLAS